jgi:uncharacterized protein (TIGR03435 family)
MRTQIAFVLTLLASTLGTSLPAQVAPADEKLSFEVASIKPTKPQLPGPSWGGGRGRYSVVGITTLNLIRNAFDLKSNEVVGTPAWVETEQFEINATYLGESTPAREEAMLQSLLADRFALKFHRETRELPKYRLALSRTDGALGSQLTKSAGTCQRPHPFTPCSMRATNGEVMIEEGSVPYFLHYLESIVGRRIVDETRLAGDFDLKLEWSRGQNDTVRPSIFTALQEQLGLKLEPTRGPVSVLVIDSIERPTPD